MGPRLTSACSVTPAGLLVGGHRVVHHPAMPKSEGLAGGRLNASVRWSLRLMGPLLAACWLISALTGCTTGRPLVLPAGWRSPAPHEVAQEWRKDDPLRFLRVGADFNGDNVMDEARLLVKTDASGMALVVFLSNARGFTAVILDQIDEPGWLDAMGIALAAPGEYRTACGKGYVDCEPGESEELMLQRPAIDYFKEESANSFFYWDDRAASFKRVWISD